MHLAPRGDSHTMGDSNPAETFGYVARELGRRNLAFLASREHPGDDQLGPQLKKAFGGIYFANENYTLEAANAAIAAGDADAVLFGKQFIANPDLPRRFAEGAPLNEPDFATFYGGGAKGYVDYPFLPESRAAAE